MTQLETTLENSRFGIPISEQLATNASLDLTASRILCLTSGRGQTAIHLADRLKDARVVCHVLEAFAASETAELIDECDSNVLLDCSADLPEEEFDLCVLPMSRSGETGLTRDWLQQAYDRLAMNGILVVTIDQKKETWFHHELEKFGKNLTRIPKRKGVVYKLKKLKPLKKLKDFSSEFAFRDREQLIKAVSRPGVFSHRRLDLGARALMESMEIEEGDRVLDIGCGAGVVGLAAAKRASDVSVHFVDSNPRALECALAGAELNGISDVDATLSHDGAIGSEDDDMQGQFDVVLGNPPYYSHFQIAEIFLQSGLKALRPGGRIQIVTKNEEWLQARMEQLFDEATTTECRGYAIVSAIQRGS
ncbi:Ribosomal RNA small subunit methyltransferase C [Thalassoglobus neptunius]|uniref:Ribosomal RNA small subunit methyltransferase C n=1 Tax=Thalassoglobus neptunius TaxID=1938619 RepID=A0A5C5X2C0_9PLAN|nr:methyltransferase [Thalassoglobus neptunius]TWT56769.1 Ribosomal RNA small subunit methyltransferase C [Thalassoglobus neptunius]